MKTKLVIFGITGDLSRRKLLPALDHILARDDQISIIGVSRRDVDVPALLEGSIGHSAATDRVSVFTMNLAQASDYVGLKEYIDLQLDEQVLIYLSVPPSAAADIVDFLGQAGLNSENVKLLFEKPFGFDLKSAQDYIERTSKYYDESQIYRIDHYAAKEVAREIVRHRTDEDGGWGAASIASIDIVAAEKIGIEGRADFYEETGALRDFVQGHLMQLLALVLMPLPNDFDDTQLSKYRLQALEEIEPGIVEHTIRAQYAGYQEEAKNKGSLTETFVSLPLHSSDEKWQGVALRLITGKGLNEKRSYIKLTHHDGTETNFDEEKVPAEQRAFSDAYERVLVHAIEGNKSVFTTSPELLRAWEIVRPVQEAWNMDNAPLRLYVPGSSIEQIVS